MNITLRTIVRDNLEACILLQPAPEQQKFVAPNVESLAQAYVEPTLNPYAIYADEEMVGFVMYGLDWDDNNYWVYRLMIAPAHQGKGYAKAAMREVIDRLAATPDCTKAIIGFHPDNLAAAKLYASLGFEDGGKASWGEQLMVMTFPR